MRNSVKIFIIAAIGWTALSILVMLGLFSLTHRDWLKPGQIGSGVKAVIIPHHLLVEPYMEKFYGQLAGVHPEWKRIVIISPNHFNYGARAVRSALKLEGDDGHGGTFAMAIDQEAVQKLADLGAVNLEDKYYEREHGVFVQDKFLDKYFPEAKVVPVIIKNGANLDSLQRLAHGLIQLDDGQTLFLFSVDFSHYTDEDSSVKNDQRTLGWLESMGGRSDLEQLTLLRKNAISMDNRSADSVAVDSPESLWILSELAEKDNWKFHLWARTSSASFAGMKDPTQNTSHIFGWLSE